MKAVTSLTFHVLMLQRAAIIFVRSHPPVKSRVLINPCSIWCLQLALLLLCPVLPSRGPWSSADHRAWAPLAFPLIFSYLAAAWESSSFS